jgi:hypothetical protein
MDGIRYANIGLGVMFVILLAGGILLQDVGKAALQALALFAFISGCVVYVALDERNKRREKRARTPQ